MRNSIGTRSRLLAKMDLWKVAIFLVVIGLPGSIHCQTNWNVPAHSWGGSGTDYADSLAKDSQGNVYVAGGTNSFGSGGTDVLLLKYDATGHFLWAKTWGGGNDEYATSVAVGPDGFVYVTGGTFSFGAGWFDIFLLKLDIDGNLIWATTWGGGSYDVGHDIGFDSAGNIYVVGEEYSFGPCCSSAVLLKFTTSGGAPIWTAAWKGPATYDTGYSLAVDSNGNVIVAGISWDYSASPLHNSLLLVKYDAAGNYIWSKTWATPMPGQDESWSFRGVTTDTSGNIYVGGRHANNCPTTDFSQCDFDALVLKLGPDGSFQWARTWGGTGYDTAASLAIDPSGRLVVSEINNVFGTPELSIMSFDTGGSMLSRSVWSTTTAPGMNLAGMMLDETGTAVVAAAGLNNSGSWLSTPLPNVASLPDSFVTNPYSINNPVGFVSNLTNIPTVIQNGARDTGGGAFDALVLVVRPQNPPSTGTILVTTNLVAATFTISGSANFSGSGISTTLQNVPIGTYTITFGSASGYITPPQQTQTLLAGGTLKLSANYVPILLQMSPSNVFFNYQAGTMTAPPSQPISVTTSTNTSVPTMISVNTTPADGTWFSITSSRDTTPSMLTVSVMTGLGPGTYSGTVTVTSTGALNGPQAIPVTLQVTTPGGPFSSTAIWRKLNGSWNSDCDGSFGAIAVDPGNRDTVYVGSSRSSRACGLYKSTNSGKTWTAINTGFPQFGIFPFQQYPSVSKIAIAPSDHSVVYVGTIFGDGTFGQILRSDNAGRIWTDASGQPTLGIFAPTINAPVLDISISPTDASIVFVGLSKAGIFKTQDNGKDWTLVQGGTLVEGETDNFYVVRFAQSNLSMAYGAGFTAFSGSLFPCVISEGGAGDCVDFQGDVPFFPFVLTTENGGTRFSPLPHPATILGNGPLITDLAIDPFDSNTVYASTIAYAALSEKIIPAPVPNLGVFKTQDGGLHWNPVNGSSDLNVSQYPLFRLVMDPTDPHTLYAVAGASGIFVTTNGGQNWERVSMDGLPTGTFIGNLALGNNRRLYALTSSGVYTLGN